MFETIGSALGAGLGQAGDVLSAPRRALWSALGGPESGSELVSKLTGMDPESGWTKALGFGAEVLGDPLTYAGGFLGKLGGAAAKAAPAAEAASPVAKMLGLRRGFGMVKDVVPAAEADAAMLASPRSFQSGGLIGKYTGGVPPVKSEFAEAGNLIGSEAANGAYINASKQSPGFGVVMRGSDNPNTLRHETIHGLMDRARQTGDFGGLPLAMRIPARMQASGSPLLRGLGAFGEEGAAQALENRGLGAQLSRAARFAISPDPFYVQQAADVSPLAGRLIQYGPRAALGAGAAAGFGGAGYAASNQ
jgi:hypothetical protein